MCVCLRGRSIMTSINPYQNEQKWGDDEKSASPFVDSRDVADAVYRDSKLKEALDDNVLPLTQVTLYSVDTQEHRSSKYAQSVSEMLTKYGSWDYALVDGAVSLPHPFVWLDRGDIRHASLLFQTGPLRTSNMELTDDNWLKLKMDLNQSVHQFRHFIGKQGDNSSILSGSASEDYHLIPLKIEVVSSCVEGLSCGLFMRFCTTNNESIHNYWRNCSINLATHADNKVIPREYSVYIPPGSSSTPRTVYKISPEKINDGVFLRWVGLCGNNMTSYINSLDQDPSGGVSCLRLPAPNENALLFENEVEFYLYHNLNKIAFFKEDFNKNIVINPANGKKFYLIRKADALDVVAKLKARLDESNVCMNINTVSAEFTPSHTGSFSQSALPSPSPLGFPQVNISVEVKMSFIPIRRYKKTF